MEPTQRFVHPDTVISHFHIRPGDQVADFGAGRGYFIPKLADAVGSDGVVYACEIQKGLVETIGEMARTQNMPQVRVLWCDLEEEKGVSIPNDSIDVGILVNTLFQIDNKEAALVEIIRTLRPGAKCIIIDWSESFQGLGPEPDAVLTADAARALCESAGLTFETSFDAGDHHYGMLFRVSS